MSDQPLFSRPFGEISRIGKFVVAALGVAAAALCLRLWPEWRHNPDLSHSLFMPVIFLVLLHESRRGTPRFLRPTPGIRSGFFLLLGGGLLMLVIAGLYAASVDWSHPLVNLSLTLSLVLFLSAALLAFSRESVRLVPLNWSSVIAVLLWLLTTPIPPGTYARLTLGLQLWVTEETLRALHVLGIPAVRHGNVIELAHTSVGVEEACSGIRSLISCVFAGVFFSATLVSRPGARAVIIMLAAPIALAMNFLRSMILTLLANRGVDISGTWHDLTGFAVLGVTAAILGVLALLLERPVKKNDPTALPPARAVTLRSRTMEWTMAGALAIAAVLVGIFVGNTHPSVRANKPPPDLFALLPASASGWAVKTSDLFEFRGTLQTNFLAQRFYVRPTDAVPTEIIIYVAYWPAGQAPVSLVASHTPDACWPGSGWTAVTPPVSPDPLIVGDRVLPHAEYRVFEADHQPQHVWFWHIYDGRPIAYRDPYSATELLRIALRYGFRHDGDQVFVRVSSNRPWSEIAHEPLLAEFFARARAIGL